VPAVSLSVVYARCLSGLSPQQHIRISVTSVSFDQALFTDLDFADNVCLLAELLH